MPEIQSMNPRHYKILDLCLAGINNKDIATRLDMVPSQISIITNSPSFQHELAIRRSSISEQVDNTIANETKDAMHLLKENTLRAAQTLVNQLSSEQEKIAQASAMDILDRAGFPKVTKSSNTNLNAVVCIDLETAELLRDSLMMSNSNNEGV